MYLLLLLQAFHLLIIYNALLKVDGIKIIERHEHSRDVVYIKDGKDAAVSYKSADLKFKNKLDYDIKLRAYVKNNRIVITLKGGIIKFYEFEKQNDEIKLKELLRLEEEEIY